MREIKILSVLDVQVVDQRNDDENSCSGSIIVYWMELGSRMGNEYAYKSRYDNKVSMCQALKMAAELIEQSDY